MSQSHVGETNCSCNNTNSFNTNNSFNNTISINNVHNVGNFGRTDERAEILAWLSPLEPRIRHDSIREHRVEDVGDWLLRAEEYRNWFDSTRGGEPGNSALLCYGNPGVGKTYITSLVIDTLGDCAGEQNAAVACFYFDFAAQKEQSPAIVLSSLLKQVVGGLEEVPVNIVQIFRDQKRVIGGRRLGLSQMVEMLRDIASSRSTFICIDALDECMAEYRATLLDSLEKILHKSPSTRIFLAGRPHIRDDVEKHFTGRIVAVSITPTKDDIIRFLRAKLKEDTSSDAMNKILEEDIIKTIPEKVSEIFLLVSLNMKAILGETTLHRRREKLGRMANGWGLGDAYDVTIGRIKTQEEDRAKLGMDTLMWISHSERPLSADEICHALAIEIGSADININDVPSIRIVLDCCQGLATIDKGSSTIRLIHFTLKEYLSVHAELFGGPHSKIAETCLTYLNFKAIRELSASPSLDPRGTPFLGYCSFYWGTHMRRELSDRSRHLALDLLDQYENHVSAELVRKSTVEWYFNSLKLFSALHCVSYFGIAELAIDLIETKRLDVNQMDSGGLTPLIWAARFGHEQVVELLLQQKDIQPDLPDVRYGRTALSWAAGSGHERVVRLFLCWRVVNPRSIGCWWGKAPRVMSLLFGRKCINPDRPDCGGQTPLSWASRTGNDRVVELLLGREDIDPDRPDNGGQTPLSWAAKNGHGRIVGLLLKRGDVSSDRPDNYGRTPLLWAARNGCDGVAKLLLERQDIDPDTPDDDGRTSLSWAARNGCDGVVKLLLEREDVTLNRLDNDDRTPLSWAARNGRDGVVELLLGREDIGLDWPDNQGQTPLLWAARNRHHGVVKRLKARNPVTPWVV